MIRLRPLMDGHLAPRICNWCVSGGGGGGGG